MTHRPYPTYKDSGIEWLGEIPEHWEVKRIRQILTGLEQGWSPVAEDRIAEDEEWAVIKLSAIKAGHFYSNEHKVLDQSVVIPQDLELKIGDVLLTRANTPDLVGDACIVRDSRQKLIFSDLVFRLKVVQADLLPEFLLNFLISKPGRVQIQLDAKGSNQSMVKISQGSISTWVIPLPCLPEQQAIAAFLDCETAKIDKLVAEQERLIELLTEKRQAVISLAVTRGLDPSVPLKDSGVEWLGQVPEHWGVKRFRHILNGLEQGWSPVAEDRNADDEEWAVIKLSAIKAGRFYSNEHKALEQSVAVPKNLELKIGDVLLTRANTPDLVGDACIVRESRLNLIFSDLVFRLIIEEDLLSPEFLLAFLISRSGRSQIQLDARGSNQSMVKISQGSISTWILPLPPLPEQHAIAAYLDGQTSQFDTLMAEARRGIELLKERRAALISAAVTGKIDVRESS